MAQRVGMAAALLLTAVTCSTSEAGITRIEVTERKPAFGGASFGAVGEYEVLRGRAFGELDPADPHNRVIVDLGGAPRNARGRVEYDTDVVILRPVNSSRANGRVVFELNNRGAIRVFDLINDGAAGNDLAAPVETGTGFLMRQGYTVVECGWDVTVRAGNRRLTIRVPVARNADGGAIVGPALQEIVVDGGNTTSATLTYKTSTLDRSKAQLTVRHLYSDAPQVLSADSWEFSDDSTVTLLPRGTRFAAGSLYELTYQAIDPLVAGIGFAAVRDVATFLRTPGSGNPAGSPVQRMYTAGVSQPIRFAHDFVALGFNQSESGSLVFDGMLNWVAGASGGFFNYRFAQPGVTHRQHIGRWFPEFAFPFANQTMTDTVTHVTAGRLQVCQASNTCPKVFEVNSEGEYWAKGMSLLHTDSTGKDLADLPNVRLYLLSNLPHSPVRQTDLCQQPPNPVVPGPSLRALLVALDQWATDGVLPPASEIPRVSDGTLVAPTSQQTIGFPSIPGVTFNGRMHTGDLFDYGPNWRSGILTLLPPKLLGMPYPILVPKTNGDGTDVAGVHQVEIAVPTATYTGWGLRKGAAAGDGCDHIGQRIPFASTRAERDRTGDPRLSIEERYPTHAAYVERVRAVARDLVQQRFLLTEDADRYVQQADSSAIAR